MKRKVKLFASIASLCLAVALMAFGVYAATQVTYNVTGSVSFESQVAVTWTGNVTGGTLGEAQNDTYKVTADGTGDQGTGTWEIGEIAFGTQTAQRTITYTFTCTNNGTDPVKVSATASSMYKSDTLDVTIKEGKQGETTEVDSLSGTNVVTLNTTEVYELTITVYLNDITKELAGTLNLGLALKAGK